MSNHYGTDREETLEERLAAARADERRAITRHLRATASATGRLASVATPLSDWQIGLIQGLRALADQIDRGDHGDRDGRSVLPVVRP